MDIEQSNWSNNLFKEFTRICDYNYSLRFSEAFDHLVDGLGSKRIIDRMLGDFKKVRLYYHLIGRWIMKITLICDNIESWTIPYINELKKLLDEAQQESRIVHRYEDIEKGELAFFLGCETIVPKSILALHTKNLVIHESRLPKGKGWSPVTWQVLEGKNIIPITLFEADSKVDSGEIYLQDEIVLEGHELLPEIKHLQGEYTIKLVIKFVELYPEIAGKKQEGNSTYYPRRTPKDSQLDINRTIKEQFNLLRVVDNDRYPAFLLLDGVKYYIKIEKGELQ